MKSSQYFKFWQDLSLKEIKLNEKLFDKNVIFLRMSLIEVLQRCLLRQYPFVSSQKTPQSCINVLSFETSVLKEYSWH